MRSVAAGERKSRTKKSNESTSSAEEPKTRPAGKKRFKKNI